MGTSLQGGQIWLCSCMHTLATGSGYAFSLTYMLHADQTV